MSTIDLEVVSDGAHCVYRPRQQHGLSAQGNFALSALETSREMTVLFVSRLRYFEGMHDCKEELHEKLTRGLMSGDCGGKGRRIPDKVR
jgi:hypothetical protein